MKKKLTFKKKDKLFYLASILFVLIAISFLFIAFLISIQENLNYKYFYLFFSSLLLIFLAFVFIIIYLAKEKNYRKINSQIFEEMLETIDGGIVFFNEKNTIIWTSKNLENVIKIGDSIKNVFLLDTDQIKWTENQYLDITQNLEKNIFDAVKKNTKNKNFFEKIVNFDTQIVQINNFYYEVNFFWNQGQAILKNVTNEKLIAEQYNLEQNVIGEISIDNFDYYLNIFSEEQIFEINSKIFVIFDKLGETYNLRYKNYTNGKYWIITNKDTLLKWEKLDFNFIRNIFVEGELITLSIGFGSDTQNLNNLENLAKKAVENSQIRGGNQVTIFSYIEPEKIRRYGSYSKIKPKKGREKVAKFSQTLINKIKAKNIENIIIYGHKIADLDALGSAFALAVVAQKFNKKAYIQNKTFDKTSKIFIEKHSKIFPKDIFINENEANKLTNHKTLVIVTDTAEIERTENQNLLDNLEKNNLFLIDHHRIYDIQNNKLVQFCLPSQMYIETSASSSCEIISEIIYFANLTKNINTEVYQIVLNGIYVDTNKLQKVSSFRTFSAVSFLQENGAQIEKSIEILKITTENNQLISRLIENLQEIKPGFFLAYSDIEAETDLISIASNRILEIKDREASFVIAKLPKSNKYKMSARSLNSNVQIIAEAVGGGGHFSIAAAEFEEKEKEKFISNLKFAIVSRTNENNFN